MTAPDARPATARFIACQSMLELSAYNPIAARAMLDPQTMHRLVMSGFYGWTEPGIADPRAQLGVLHTWSADLCANTITLIVQSRMQPDWSALHQTRALIARPHMTMIDEKIAAGFRYRFRAIVNPTRQRARPVVEGQPDQPHRRSQRVSDTTPHHARQWFAQRLQPVGEPDTGPDGIRRIGATADPDTLAVKILPKLTMLTDHHGMRIGRADIRGTLTVTDPNAFTRTLTEGIGKARAYSTGMLLIRDAEPS